MNEESDWKTYTEQEGFVTVTPSTETGSEYEGDVEEVAKALDLTKRGEEALEKKQEQWWGRLVELYQRMGGQAFFEVEKRYKELSGSTSMPSSYRSAKSVIQKAAQFGVLRSGQGKTATEKAIKEKKKELEKEDKANEGDKEAYVDKKLKQISKIRKDIAKHSTELSEDEIWEIHSEVQRLMSDLESMVSGT